MKKRIFIILLAISAFQWLLAAKEEKAQRDIRVWTITDKTASVVPSAIDTTLFNFPNEDAINNYSIANAYNASMISPLQSRIYFDRTEKSDFLFSRPYDAFYKSPTDLLWYNTKTPYTNLTYLSRGDKLTHDDDIDAIFTINANKNLNFGGLFKYVLSNGVYDEQTAKQAVGGAWLSYSGKHYAMNAAYMYQSFNNKENGGITDPAFITNPDTLGDYPPANIPVRLDSAQSRYKNSYVYINQKFHLVTKKHQIDSVTVEYNPIASIFHTLKYELAQKRYLGAGADSLFYANSHYDKTATLDSTRYKLLRNTLGFSINEGFSRYFPLSVITYVEHDYRELLNQVNDSTMTNAYENDYILGAEISKRNGKHFLFSANGELCTAGTRMGDFKLDGAISSAFAVYKDTVSFSAKAFLKNTSPTYFENQYFSNHFKWDNDFDKTLRERVEGDLAWQNKWFEVKFGIGAENVSNLIYYDETAMPQQYSSDIQLLSANAELNLNLWILHLQNKGIYQESSNETVMPLPKYSTYNNIFVAFKMFKKVLHTQIGADMYYFTSYYTPTYMPATGIFYNQTQEKVGFYPVMSAYLNFHLKTARFYFKYYHINSSTDPQYFSMPNYPLNPMRFQMGLSWNFFD